MPLKSRIDKKTDTKLKKLIKKNPIFLRKINKGITKTKTTSVFYFFKLADLCKGYLKRSRSWAIVHGVVSSS